MADQDQDKEGKKPLVEDSEDRNFSFVVDRPEPETPPPQERDTSDDK